MRAGSWRVAWALSWALVLVWGGACDSGDAQRLPSGAWLVGEGDAIRAAAADLGRLSGTPMADAMHQLLERTEGCEQIVAHSVESELAIWLDSARCADPEVVPPSLAALRGPNDFAFVLPVTESVRVSGAGRRSTDGGLRVVADLHLASEPGLARLFVPADQPAGPPRLSGSGSLLHARVRPEGGLHLSDWIASGGQADRLFRLKSQLFEGAALAGAWEVALYPPPDGMATPALAMALDVQSAAIAQHGVDTFVADLERTWPLRHRSVRIAAQPAACFLELRILPDFAPCWVLSEQALIVGWNPQSVERAMAPAGDSPGLVDAGGLRVDFEQLALADRHMQITLAGDPESATPGYAWDLLSIRPLALPAGLRLEIDLVGSGRDS